MDTDLILTLGILLLVLTVPTLLSAWVDGRVPRLGAIMVVAAIVLIVVALQTVPGGYAFESIPGVVFSVITRPFQ